jgi:acyl-CoA reductase-like NAD-dependent aldehyde dehydrogenase
MMIDGQKVRTGREIEVINPATGEVFATAARADEAVLDAAVAAAERSFPAWRGKKAQNAIAQTVATAAVRRRRLMRTLVARAGCPNRSQPATRLNLLLVLPRRIPASRIVV